MVREITDREGTNITNPVLRHANGVRFKRWTHTNCTSLSTPYWKAPRDHTPSEFGSRSHRCWSLPLIGERRPQPIRKGCRRILRRQQHLASMPGLTSRLPLSWPTSPWQHDPPAGEQNSGKHSNSLRQSTSTTTCTTTPSSNV